MDAIICATGQIARNAKSINTKAAQNPKEYEFGILKFSKPHMITLQSIRTHCDMLAKWELEFMMYARIGLAEPKALQDVGVVRHIIMTIFKPE